MSLVQVAAVTEAVLLGLLALFQLALLMGAPLGEFAWGGAQKVLAPNKRAASGVNIALYLIMALAALTKAGFVSSEPLEKILPFVLWVVVAFLAVGVFLNAITRSVKERAVMLPVAIVLLACQLVVTLG